MKEIIKIRFDTLLQSKGQRASEIYKPLGIDKADWSRITWGITIPDIKTKIMIAKALEVDTLVIWGER